MRLILKNGWSIVPQNDSFLFYEMSDIDKDWIFQIFTD